MLNCLKKSDSDLQKILSFSLSRRTDSYNGMSEGLIQINIKDGKINGFSPNVVVKGLFQCQFLILKVRSDPHCLGFMKKVFVTRHLHILMSASMRKLSTTDALVRAASPYVPGNSQISSVCA